MLGSTKAHLHDLEKGRAANPTLRLIAAFVNVYGIRARDLIATAEHLQPPQ